MHKQLPGMPTKDKVAKLKRLLFVLLAAVIAVSLCFVGAAHAEEEELTLPDPGITPDSPLYVFDRAMETAQEFFTRNAQARARLQVSFAAERVAEIKLLLEKNGVEAEGLDVAQTRLEAHMAKATDIIEGEQESGSDVSALAEEILDDFQQQREAMRKVFQKTQQGLNAEMEALQEQLRVANQGSDTALQERIRVEMAAIEAEADEVEADADEAIAAFEAERNRLMKGVGGGDEDDGDNDIEDLDEGADQDDDDGEDEDDQDEDDDDDGDDDDDDENGHNDGKGKN